MVDGFDHGLPDNPYNKHAWIVGDVDIGKNVWIGAFTLLDGIYQPLKIGKGVNVSSGAQILTHSTVKRCVSEKRHGEVDAFPTQIGDFCFIGTNAVILMGVELGHHSVVAAGAVVSEKMKIPPYSLVAGVPAKIVGSSKKFLRGVEKESISVAIPAFNEEKTIKEVVEKAMAAVSEITKDFEIVLVDDGSKDKTGKIIDKLAGGNRKIRVIHHRKNKGFTGAMKTALYSSKKHLVFLAPADGQFDFRQLSKFTEAIKGYDMVIGYRKKTEENVIRKLGSWSIYFLYRKLFKIPIREISTVFMWRKRVIDSIEIDSDDRSAMFLYEFFYKALREKYKYIELPVVWGKRKKGKAKGRNLKTIQKTLFEMLRIWIKTRLNTNLH